MPLQSIIVLLIVVAAISYLVVRLRPRGKAATAGASLCGGCGGCNHATTRPHQRPCHAKPR